LGNTRGQILEFPIEMAGHLYNRAGATAQPVINDNSQKHLHSHQSQTDSSSPFRLAAICLKKSVNCFSDY